MSPVNMVPDGGMTSESVPNWILSDTWKPMRESCLFIKTIYASLAASATKRGFMHFRIQSPVSEDTGLTAHEISVSVISNLAIMSILVYGKTLPLI
jgi:hypothetical protein